MDAVSAPLAPANDTLKDQATSESFQHSNTTNLSHSLESQETLAPSGDLQRNQRQKQKRNFGNRKNTKGDLGRNRYRNIPLDKRIRNDAEHDTKRRRLERGEQEVPVYATKYSQEEIDDDVRKPKRKVAVMIGYNGSGYKGMQLDHKQKTIEGDLFQAFVKAKAISKVNADDPKKSSFVRCARTDKGVHAAGNVISLKLIIEDPEVVTNINENLPPQIRVWGIERTKNSFSSYQLCDSRVYEYLIPTYSFLPPHPKSFLGRQTVKIAEEEHDLDGWKSRQEEVEGFWNVVDEKDIRPLLADLDDRRRKIIEMALFPSDGELERFKQAEAKDKSKSLLVDKTGNTEPEQVEAPLAHGRGPGSDTFEDKIEPSVGEYVGEGQIETQSTTNHESTPLPAQEASSNSIQATVKALRAAYISAKRCYRITPRRLSRIQQALSFYIGTRNFHNYTIEKSHSEPSAKRIIKSFTLNPQPILINGTEWLSLKVHGQSFMMHQIRKMVSMVALVVRCGCDPERIKETYGSERFAIPKAPGLGLLLERPVFESYNKRCEEYERSPITFEPFEKEIEKFKQEQIYERIYQDEETHNVFGNFFNHIDNFQKEPFLFVTSGGLKATRGKGAEAINAEADAAQADVDIDAEIYSELEESQSQLLEEVEG